MKMYDSPQEVGKYLNVELECDCGRTHYAPIKAVDISSGAINSLPRYVRELGYHKPYIICDSITYKIAAQKCEELLHAAGYQPNTLMLKHTAFDEATLGEIVINKPDDCDVMIGCGTGSITDMLRFSSFKLGLPCFTVATGAPMDGFAASVGIMNVDNLKATMPAHSSEVIIGDTDILKGAPYRMTVAGFDDLIGKLNALDDWRLARLIHGDHYCEKIDALVTDCVSSVMAKSGRIKERDGNVLGEVMNGLILSGAVISLYGSSRPISGAEHHMSHYWEALGDQRGKQYAMHGEQVAVGTVLALMLIDELRHTEPDFALAREKAAQYDFEQWKREIRSAYGSAADAVIELEEKAGKNECAGRLRRIDIMQRSWPEILAIMARVPSPESLIETLTEIGSPYCPKDIGLDATTVKNTFMYCKETRDRYTVYQLAWDLGLMDSLSDKVIDKLKAAGQI